MAEEPLQFFSRNPEGALHNRQAPALFIILCFNLLVSSP